MTKGTDVQIINTDGSALFGVGSEWFWSMAQFVVVAVTLVAIYRQVRIQLHTTTFEQARALSEAWASERMLRARLAVLLASQASANAPTVPIGASAIIANHWEAVGNLVKTGHVDLDQLDGLSCRIFWARLNAFGFVELGRTRAKDPEVLANFGRLAGRYAEQARKSGLPADFDRDALAQMLPGSIEAVREALAIEEELRAVIVRPVSTAALQQDSTASSSTPQPTGRP